MQHYSTVYARLVIQPCATKNGIVGLNVDD